MPTPVRFYLLDTLRGLASLIVVVWHYQHFFFDGPGKKVAGYETSQQPFFDVFRIFYTDGHRAVQLFFVLSGFVFFLTYATSVSERRVGAREFFILRFSRLYPLHAATLVLVALGQLLSIRWQGTSVVYAFNDLKHFVLNLFLISEWGLQKGFSFNGPIWSVSVEVFLYIVFFGLMRFAIRRERDAVLGAVAMMVVGGLLLGFAQPRTLTILGQGLLCFFAGGLTYQLWRMTERWGRATKISAALGSIVIGAVATSAFRRGWIAGDVFHVTVFPAMILVLAMVQAWRPTLGRATRLVGDITYSTYLVHFPVQLAIVLAVRRWDLPIDYRDGRTFVAFVAAVILVAIPTYYAFELPAQGAIRRRLLAARPANRERKNQDENVGGDESRNLRAEPMPAGVGGGRHGVW